MTAAARPNVVPLRAVPALDEAYRASISVHFPNTDPMTMAVRVELMALRDRASAGLRRCGDESAPMLAEAVRLASLAALSGSPIKTLAFTRVAVESLIFAADMMRRAQA